jgi:membrane protease YdiL (CAAX protease family)
MHRGDRLRDARTGSHGPTLVTDWIEAPRRLSQRPEEGLKVWYLVAIVVLLFQLLPPEFCVAHVFGFYHQLLHHITQRTSKIPSLLGAAVILTLFETIVYQVCVQERLSWFIGTPAAILVAAVLAGFAHAAGVSGSFNVVLTDSAGVALDFIVFGIIWARTHNLPLTWATHYAADVVGIIALTMIF